MKLNILYVLAVSKQFLCNKAEAYTAGQSQMLKSTRLENVRGLWEEKNSTKYYCKR